MIEDFLLRLNASAQGQTAEDANTLHGVLGNLLGDRAEIDPRSNDLVSTNYLFARQPPSLDTEWWRLRVMNPALRGAVEAMGALCVWQSENWPGEGEAVGLTVDYSHELSRMGLSSKEAGRVELIRDGSTALTRMLDLSEVTGSPIMTVRHRTRGREKMIPRHFVRLTASGRIKDAAAFKAAMENGIGRAKGYGFGLIIINGGS